MLKIEMFVWVTVNYHIKNKPMHFQVHNLDPTSEHIFAMRKTKDLKSRLGTRLSEVHDQKGKNYTSD